VTAHEHPLAEAAADPLGAAGEPPPRIGELGTNERLPNVRRANQRPEDQFGVAHMTRVEGPSVVIDRPVADVWNYIIDVSNVPHWEDSGAVWKPTTEGPIGSGSTYQSSIRFRRWEYKADLRIVEFEPNSKFSVEALSGFGKGTRITYLMESVDGGRTRLRRVTEMRLHGPAKLLRPLQAPLLRRTGRMEANNLKRILEAQH
jgi:hypothetical protein